MPNLDDPKMQESLKELGESIMNSIRERCSKGEYLPREEEYIKWKLNNFSYTDLGVVSSGAQSESITKKVWWSIISHAQTLAKQSKQYQDLKTLLETTPNYVKSPLLDNFVERISRKCFIDEKFSTDDVEYLSSVFIKDLKNEPVKIGTDIELKGIALRSKKITITPWITLRQTEISDIEKEIPTYQFGRLESPDYPSAIMKIEIMERNQYEIQHKVWRAIAILRLFKVGSIQYIRYKMYSESFHPFLGGILSALEKIGPFDTCLIKEEDENNLKKFWERIERYIPNSFYESGTSHIDFKTISYKRYEEALLQNGTIERRISNAVMGLEGLFLRGGNEQGELSYRLRLRVARLVSFFGYQALDVKKAVADAYIVRNQYVHGGLLSYEGQKEIEEKYGDAKNLLLKILDCLRISIVNFIMSTTSKDEFIDTIDKSFIDEKSLEKLKNMISRAKYVFDVN